MSSKFPDLPQVETLTYEQALAELESLIAALESEHQDLAAALALFERGQALTRRCTELLDQAELKIQLLTADGLSDLPPQA